MLARGPQCHRLRLLAIGVAAGVAAGALSGCVSEATYHDALQEAQRARAEAAQREQQSRVQQAQLAWLAQQIEQHRNTTDPAATAELARNLATWAEQVKSAPCNSAPPGDAADGGDLPAARPALRVRGGSQKLQPLDRSDPWLAPLRAGAPAGKVRGRAALVAQPLDNEDPWASLRPALDGGDPWKP